MAGASGPEVEEGLAAVVPSEAVHGAQAWWQQGDGNLPDGSEEGAHYNWRGHVHEEASNIAGLRADGKLIAFNHAAHVDAKVGERLWSSTGRQAEQGVGSASLLIVVLLLGAGEGPDEEGIDE